MFSGIPDSVKLKNADGTTGRENAGSLVCFSLANEDFALLTTISAATGQFAFQGDRLKVDAEIDGSDIQIGAVEIKNGTSDDRVVIKTDGTDFAMVVTQNSQPLPTGAATEATLGAINAKFNSLGQKAMSGSLSVVMASDQGPIAVTISSSNFNVAQWGGANTSLGQKVMTASVPVVLASDEVVPISAASLPLPAGAATEATLGSVLADLDKFTFLAGLLRVDGSGVTQPVSAVSLPLPSGASTSANQVTANASLASIDGKLPASLGQQLSAASLGVVIASDQTAIPVTIASLPLPTGAATAANQVAGNSSLSSIDTKITGVALEATLQSILTDTNKFTFAATRLLTDGSGVTQPMSAASLPLPTGASTAANQVTANNSLSSIDGKLNSLGQKVMVGSVPVVIASDQTVAISAASLPLPTGAATSANQTTANNSLASIDGKLGTLGQKAMTGSAPVVLASDQSAIRVIPQDGARITYTASVTNLAAASLATDIFTITGSASRTIRVTKVEVSAFSGGNSNNTIILLKRSTANTGGTSAAQAAVPHDSLSAAATATVLAYTANPTTGTLVGNMVPRRMATPATNNAAQSLEVLFNCDRPSQAIVLRGVNEVLAVNLNGVTIAGTGFSISIEWTEET